MEVSNCNETERARSNRVVRCLPIREQFRFDSHWVGHSPQRFRLCVVLVRSASSSRVSAGDAREKKRFFGPDSNWYC